ncbi:MAG: hypothetical protein BWK80_18975 [Desulfobacteraceae bacterium IS3]|nr:MAG: hypothetical protein BWK80_18975 [Desulfobacteraceae bacterium IS3]
MKSVDFKKTIFYISISVTDKVFKKIFLKILCCLTNAIKRREFFRRVKETVAAFILEKKG